MLTLLRLDINHWKNHHIDPRRMPTLPRINSRRPAIWRLRVEKYQFPILSDHRISFIADAASVFEANRIQERRLRGQMEAACGAAFPLSSLYTNIVKIIWNCSPLGFIEDGCRRGSQHFLSCVVIWHLTLFSNTQAENVPPVWTQKQRLTHTHQLQGTQRVADRSYGSISSYTIRAKTSKTFDHILFPKAYSNPIPFWVKGKFWCRTFWQI